MENFYTFLVYIINFGSIIGLYFISLFNVNLAFILFILYIGIYIFIDLGCTQKYANNNKLLKIQQKELEEAKRNYDMSALVGSKLLEKYTQKTGDDTVMETIINEIKEGIENATKNKTEV